MFIGAVVVALIMFINVSLSTDKSEVINSEGISLTTLALANAQEIVEVARTLPVRQEAGLSVVVKLIGIFWCTFLMKYLPK